MTPQEIRQYRLKKGWSLRYAAKRYGVSLSTWQRWETGTGTPRRHFTYTMLMDSLDPAAHKELEPFPASKIRAIDRAASAYPVNIYETVPVSRQTWVKWCKGTSRPSVAHVKRLEAMHQWYVEKIRPEK